MKNILVIAVLAAAAFAGEARAAWSNGSAVAASQASGTTAIVASGVAAAPAGYLVWGRPGWGRPGWGWGRRGRLIARPIDPNRPVGGKYDSNYLRRPWQAFNYSARYTPAARANASPYSGRLLVRMW